MGAGRWSVQLSPDTPRVVMDVLDVRQRGFAHVVVTPTPVPVEGLSDAGMLSLARFTGVFLSQPSDFGLEGAGVAHWLGDTTRGPFYPGGLTTAAGTFAQWAAVLKPSFLSAGVVAPLAGNHVFTYPRTYLMEALTDVCARFGAEWRVNPDFSFDMGWLEHLFRKVPVATVVPRGEGGRDFSTIGVTGDLRLSRDVEDWVRAVRFYSGDQDAPTLTTASSPVGPSDEKFRNPSGGAAEVHMRVENYTAGADAASLAGRAYQKDAFPRQQFTVTTGEYDIGSDVRVGDNLNVFDPSRGIHDLTNPLLYRGQTIYPEVIRCVGSTWPVREGMGVYFRYFVKVSSSWVPRWLDLTNYVQWESGVTSVEVGAAPRKLRGA